MSSTDTGHTSGAHGHRKLLLTSLTALGVVFGDIGTSPLYVMKAIIGDADKFDELLVFGAISCVFSGCHHDGQSNVNACRNGTWD